MAARSRLGRDPLRDVAMSAGGKSTRPASKTKAARRTSAKSQSAQKSQVPPQTAEARAEPEAIGNLEAALLLEPASIEPGAPEVIAAESMALHTTDSPMEALEPVAREASVAFPSSSCGTVAPLPGHGEQALEMEPPLPAEPRSDPDTGPHPVEVFLHGVLEGLAPDGALQVSVEVAPEAATLPVEKLFYFSHALQLLVAPLDQPGNYWRRRGEETDRIASLSARLNASPGGGHALRLYDNGLFFRNYFQEIRLDMEALRPLTLFVVKRHGSICVKQGRYVEFEIVG